MTSWPGRVFRPIGVVYLPTSRFADFRLRRCSAFRTQFCVLRGGRRPRASGAGCCTWPVSRRRACSQREPGGLLRSLPRPQGTPGSAAGRGGGLSSSLICTPRFPRCGLLSRLVGPSPLALGITSISGAPCGATTPLGSQVPAGSTQGDYDAAAASPGLSRASCDDLNIRMLPHPFHLGRPSPDPHSPLPWLNLPAQGRIRAARLHGLPCAGPRGERWSAAG